MDVPTLLAVLQFADGLFPAGGFAHSFGLETYTQSRRVVDREGLQAFVTAHLEGSAGPGDAVAAAVASRLAREDDVAGCLELDARVDAMKWVPELSAASRQMGRQTLRVAARIGGNPCVTALAGAVAEGRMAGHHPVVFGAVTGGLGADAETAAAAFLYSTAALLVGAGLRLLPIGQLDGQRLLAALRPRMAALAALAATTRAEDMWSFAPGLELAALGHARLEMRLFRS